MTDKLKCLLVSPFIFIFFISSSFAEVVRFQTNDYASIAKRILAKIEAGDVRSNDVLVATDIDSTLLVPNQVLGSERWFKWQESLSNSQVIDAYQTAKSFSELLEVLRLTTYLTSMHLVQPEIANAIQSLQSRGVKVVCLTARGPANADATYRQLAANGLDFSSSAVGRIGGYGAPFLPYTDGADGHGITQELLQKLAVKNKPRPVLYARGIYLTEGQHKGVMLRTLLAKTHSSPKLIVFIDNEDKQTTRVAKAMEDQPIETWSVSYTRANENPEKPGDLREITSAEKEEAAEAWRAVKGAVDKAFPL